MKPLYKGLAVALIHILMVLSLGGKLLYDRATRPRIWVRTVSFGPDLLLRGRYLSLNLAVYPVDFNPELPSPQMFKSAQKYYGYVELAVENGQLVARKADHPTGMMLNPWTGQDGKEYFLSSPVLFFIPEHAELPRLSGGSELWAEVTVPRKGPPRPIQLAIKRGQEWIPLTYR